MKTLYLIGGTMGVGKNAVGCRLKEVLFNSVFLDGDWCWDANPFRITEETRKMVMRNITYLLNNFLECSVYENIIFCWVMHEQSIINCIIDNLNVDNCRVKIISLIASEITLRKRLEFDVANGLRTADVINRSLTKASMYKILDTVKINTDNKTIAEISDEIINL